MIVCNPESDKNDTLSNGKSDESAARAMASILFKNKLYMGVFTVSTLYNLSLYLCYLSSKVNKPHFY
jgi:hypothetical protein